MLGLAHIRRFKTISSPEAARNLYLFEVIWGERLWPFSLFFFGERLFLCKVYFICERGVVALIIAVPISLV